MVRLFVVVLVLFLSSCVYTLDVQQGNIVNQKDVDKLRPGLTKNQVVFVLGNPVVNDSFSDDKWIYLYTYSNKNKDNGNTKKLTVIFEGDNLASVEGDFTTPEAFVDSEEKPL
jgi:outer membrane protein assembly factor BamE